MARQASDAKGGFFACPPEAVAMVASRLSLAPSGPFHILDPAAGEGAAIGQLAAALQLPPEAIYAVELEDGRSETIKATLAGSNVLAPASFFGCDIRHRSFSLIWCNPPFSDALGGGRRVETDFLSRSLDLVCAGGVIVLVCPEYVAELPAIRATLLTWCDELSQFAFPPEIRKYGEVVVMGRKLREGRDRINLRWMYECLPKRDYTLPKSVGPGARFVKTQLTESELLAALNKSPLRKMLEPPSDRPLPSPPLALGAGHLALLLASGHLDGLVSPPDGESHVVRGTAVKVSEPTETLTEETEKEVKTVTKYTERIVLTVRVAKQGGEILTLS